MSILTNFFYSSSSSLKTYDGRAFTYIGNDKILGTIKQTADILGISASAIAGAMAEENDAYWGSWIKQGLSDKYAISSVDPAIIGSLPPGVDVDVNVLVFLSQFVSESRRTHAEWQALYEQVKPTAGNPLGTADDVHTVMDKLLNPVVMDLGQANFKMATATGCCSSIRTRPAA